MTTDLICAIYPDSNLVRLFQNEAAFMEFAARVYHENENFKGSDSPLPRWAPDSLKDMVDYLDEYTQWKVYYDIEQDYAVVHLHDFSTKTWDEFITSK
jgi:hypothetical protein